MNTVCVCVCVCVCGGETDIPMQEVCRALAFFSKFIIPNHINQNVSPALWRSHYPQDERKKWSTKEGSCPVRRAVSLRCEEPPLNAESVLPVGVVLDPSVCVVM